MNKSYIIISTLVLAALLFVPMLVGVNNGIAANPNMMLPEASVNWVGDVNWSSSVNWVGDVNWSSSVNWVGVSWSSSVNWVGVSWSSSVNWVGNAFSSSVNWVGSVNWI